MFCQTGSGPNYENSADGKTLDPEPPALAQLSTGSDVTAGFLQVLAPWMAATWRTPVTCRFLPGHMTPGAPPSQPLPSTVDRMVLPEVAPPANHSRASTPSSGEFAGHMTMTSLTADVCLSTELLHNYENVPEKPGEPGPGPLVQTSRWSGSPVGLDLLLVRTSCWSGPAVGPYRPLVWTSCWSGPPAGPDLPLVWTSCRSGPPADAASPPTEEQEYLNVEPSQPEDSLSSSSGQSCSWKLRLQKVLMSTNLSSVSRINNQVVHSEQR